MKQLTDDEIAAVLEDNGVGVLALDGGVYPYQVPICFGYVPAEDLFVVQLTDSKESRKQLFLDLNEHVSVTVYEETDRNTRWRSVVVHGTMQEISYQDGEMAFARLARNTQSVPNPVSWADSTDRTDLTPHKLDIEEWSGREFDIS